MKKAVFAAALATAALWAAVTLPGWADPRGAIAPAVVEKYIASSWKEAAPEWRARLEQDETQNAYTEHANAPPSEVAEAILKREQATLVYPADGTLVGDWKNGEKLAQSGYGGRFTDTDKTRENGGNCYACHQLAASEIAYGTLGPSLLGYGKARSFASAEAKAVYEKIFNSQAVVACSNMPRFGASAFLTPEQIRDIVAYVMSPESPVNK